VRVLGVDPGLTRCGLAAVDGRPGRRAQLVAVDVIRTPATADLAARLLGVGEAVEGPIGAGVGGEEAGLEGRGFGGGGRRG